MDAVREGKLKDTALTEKQQTLVTEVVAMQMEETFGSEDAINRLVGEKPNLAKRILSRIKAFLQTFGKATEKDPEAVKQLRRTEKLFRKALENAGLDYAVQESLKRMNEKNVQVSEENEGADVDEGGEVRYNGGGAQFARKIVVPKKRVDPLINDVFPPYNESESEANELATRWAHREDVETGAKALVSYHNRWYLIQKFDSMDLGYLIMKRVKVADYEWYKKEIERYGERSNTYPEILDEIDSEDGAGSVNQNDGAKSSSNSNDAGHGRKNQSVLSVDSEQVERESGADSQRNTNNERSSTDREGRKTRIKESRKIVPVESHEYRGLANTFGGTKNYEAAGYLPGGAKIHEHKPSPSTRFTHRDVNDMLENIRRESLTFTLEDGTEINGKQRREPTAFLLRG